MWHASKCRRCATTTDSPGCKLRKAITAASAGSRLRLADRMNNWRIPRAASVCGQISISQKIQHLDRRIDTHLRCTPRRVLPGLRAGNLSLIGESRQQVFIYVRDQPADTRRLRLLNLVCSAQTSLRRRAEVSDGRWSELQVTGCCVSTVDG